MAAQEIEDSDFLPGYLGRDKGGDPEKGTLLNPLLLTGTLFRGSISPRVPLTLKPKP